MRSPFVEQVQSKFGLGGGVSVGESPAWGWAAEAVKLRGASPRAQVGEHGRYAPVDVPGVLEAQLLEDLRRVGLDGALRDEQRPGDRRVRAPLCELSENFALARGQLAQRVRLTAAAHRLGHDRRV